MIRTTKALFGWSVKRREGGWEVGGRASGSGFVELGTGESEVRYFRVDPAVDTAAQDSHVPERAGLRLYPAWPNPFNGSTVIRFTTPDRALLEVLDLLGRHVRSLAVDGRAPGAGVARWDGRDDRGQAVASGVYLVRLQTASAQLATRVLLLR